MGICVCWSLKLKAQSPEVPYRGVVHIVLIPGRTENVEQWIWGVCLGACVDNCYSSRDIPALAPAELEQREIYLMGCLKCLTHQSCFPKLSTVALGLCLCTVLPEHRYLVLFWQHQSNQDTQSSHSSCRVGESSAGCLCTKVSLDICFSNLNYFSKLIQNQLRSLDRSVKYNSL